MIVTAVIAHASPLGLYVGLSTFTFLILALFLREHAEASALPRLPSRIT